MGVTLFRPGARLVIPGIQVMQTRASAASRWYDDNGNIANCVAAYQAKGVASLAASYINLANPGTYNAAPGVAPTWDATGGWTFNGTTQYLLTGVIPGSTSWSAIVRFSDVVGLSKPLFGCFESAGNKRFYIYPQDSLTAAFHGNGNGLSVAGGALTAGVLGFAGLKPYRNGVAETGTIAGGGSVPAIALVIGADNNNSIISEFMAVKIQAIAFYSATLSAGNMATIYTAMAAL